MVLPSSTLGLGHQTPECSSLVSFLVLCVFTSLGVVVIAGDLVN